MIEMITVREAAEHWNITERRVSLQERKNYRGQKAGKSVDDSG